jgi:hypothetical protein
MVVDLVEDPAAGGGGGGGGGEGPEESEENPSDGGDATPLGPFITAPVPGGPPGVPPEGICEGAVITRFIANIGDEANGITEVVDDYTFPLTPPDELGGDNYNGKSVIFRTRCPNGEEQVIDPVIEPGFDPAIFSFYRFVAPDGGTSDWFTVNTSNPPGSGTSAGVGSSSCAACGPTSFSPPPSSYFPWSASTKASVAGPHNVNALAYHRVYRSSSQVTALYTDGFVYSSGSVNCSIEPVCGSGSGGSTGSWEFTNNISEGAQASWAGNPAPFEELEAPSPS